MSAVPVLRRELDRLRRRARDHGVPDGRTGAVVCVRRFDFALRLDVHIHAIVLDGVYTDLAVSEQPKFHPSPKPTDDDIARLVRHIRVLVLGHLRRRGHVDHEDRVVRTSDEEVGTLEVCQAAAVRGVAALGPAAGRPDQQLGWAQPLRSRTVEKELGASALGRSGNRPSMLVRARSVVCRALTLRVFACREGPPLQ